MTPTLKQLEYAVAVADHLHFRKAADASHVTQPALSSQIQQLEELLGIQLFERTKRSVLVTHDGVEAIERARRVLRDVADLVEYALHKGKPFSGPLRLGVIPTIAPYLLPSWLPRVREHYPDLQIFLREDQTDGILNELREGHLDLLLLALPIEHVGLESMPLFDEPFVLVAPKEHPAVKPARVTDLSLSGEPVLLLDDGHCFRDQALSVCRLAGAHEVLEIRANSLGTLVQMVANGIGITLLPESSVTVELAAAPELVVRPFRKPVPTRTIGLVWRQSSGRAEDYRALGRFMAGRKRASSK